MPASRRQFLIRTAGLLLATTGARAAPGNPAPIRIGLTPVILDDQSRFLRRWRDWLEQQFTREVQFVQRPRYRDITGLLLRHELDAAWVCGYPYIAHAEQLRLLAVPVYRGEPRYHSLIIRGRQHDSIKRAEDLAGFSFAFSDPDSNSGYLYPMYRLREALTRQPDFFRRTFFTWGHRNTIEAVAAGLADAGAVDSYVWETLQRRHPEYAEQAVVVERSPAFGFPPLVTHVDTPPQIHQRLAEVLLRMHEDDEGRVLLEQLALDRFVAGQPDQYAGIHRMLKKLRRLELVSPA
ncbi:PhnD/SsuA/transferrin family substrate-binding protein [Thiohalophilus sp.]|uniref:substrate-binding domain-containing protein n=1 Tax=Thiohalophilus sp. TaxID=3028392 RepID=UPI002ACDBCFD|nr:PhnD/SsuA/transferrin family substrate-binding protein [Thiohalophilus sp.]MDZ7663340.1 PhnD/SsuA/transferrin family substrate-binding protein [Thiohalophilus sp.]